MYQVIQFHPQYGLIEDEMFSNDKTYFVPTGNAWLLAVLHSPMMWWHNWRYIGHMKDEAENPAAWRTEDLPIAPPTKGTLCEAEVAAGRLVSLATSGQEAQRDTLDWLRVEFGVEKPGQKLADFASLDADEFVEEVRKRRPNGMGPLAPAMLKALRSGYSEMATPVHEKRTEAANLEGRLSDLVNNAYGLTPKEIDLL